MVAHHVLHVAATQLAVGLHIQWHHLSALLAVDEREICVHAALEAVEVTPRAGIAATECAEIGRRICS